MDTSDNKLVPHCKSIYNSLPQPMQNQYHCSQVLTEVYTVSWALSRNEFDFLEIEFVLSAF